MNTYSNIIRKVTSLLFLCLMTQAYAASNLEQGDAELSAGNVMKAIQQYQIALKNSPNSAIARTRLAACYMRKGYKSSSLRLIDEALSIDPNNVDALILSSRLLLSENKLDEAMQLLYSVISVDRNNTEALTYLARIHNNKGDVKTADEIYSKIEALQVSN